MTQFYQTTEFYQQVAVSVVLIIMFAFALKGRFKSKKKQVKPVAYWTAPMYFAYLHVLIKTSLTMQQVQDAKALVEDFHKKDFHPIASNREIQRYKTRLRAAIGNKEKEFQQQAVLN